MSSFKFEDKLYLITVVCDNTCELRWTEASNGRQITQGNIFIGKTSEINGISKVFIIFYVETIIPV